MGCLITSLSAQLLPGGFLLASNALFDGTSDRNLYQIEWLMLHFQCLSLGRSGNFDDACHMPQRGCSGHSCVRGNSGHKLNTFRFEPDLRSSRWPRQVHGSNTGRDVLVDRGWLCFHVVILCFWIIDLLITGRSW